MIIKYLKSENRYQVTKFLKYPEKITRFFDSFEDAEKYSNEEKDSLFMFDFTSYLVNPETKTIEVIETEHESRDASIRDQFERIFGTFAFTIEKHIGIRRHFIAMELYPFNQKSFNINGITIQGKGILLAWFRNFDKLQEIRNPFISLEKFKTLVTFN
jgi:hypothetical protein